MNLSIHQYRVTPLRSSAELHLGVGHGTRHDLFLPSLFPLRHPTRKVVSGGALLSSALAPQKVRSLKTASPGRRSALLVSAFRLALSGFTVSVCREVYTNHRRTSSSFFKNFAFFSKKISKTLKNQRFQKSLFWHFFENCSTLLNFPVQNHPFPAYFSRFEQKTVKSAQSIALSRTRIRIASPHPPSSHRLYIILSDTEVDSTESLWYTSI